MNRAALNNEHWERVKELLHQALPLSPERRPQFLDEACHADLALRAEVESLLSASEDVRSSYLQTPPLLDSQDADKDRIDAVAGLEAGQIFAQHFQLVRKLGEGGMGQVWLADQTSPVRRQVALKLIKAGMYDDAVVQRFQSERQSLAIMDHPAIAKVFEAGTTPQGQPYFVMEYVPGLPITEYCDRKKLKISDRLDLFIQTCEGVQHAHQKAIIHRDLKPANILVVELDGKPVPRIIDFGLAKATTPTAGESMFTQAGHFIGTPGYMSPEQADPTVHDIDTRTDVYSLGVVLYVLLAGLQPFETAQRQRLPLDVLLRKLREEDPPRPSNKVSTGRDTSTATAEARNTEPRQLVSLLRGDLDWITMKALEKDRARRYGAPSELAADLRRYLTHEPVVARPASARYRVQKYVRRNSVAVAVAAGLVLLLAAFSAVQARELRRITLERDRANRERDRATRVTDFMTDMFKVNDPNEARGNSVTAREIIDKASKEMDTGLAKDPEVQSQMMQVMALTYVNLGLYARGHELAKRALDARLSLLGPDDPKTLESMTEVAWILDKEGHYPEAEQLERQAVTGNTRILGVDNLETSRSIRQLAFTLRREGHVPEAEKLDRQCLEVQLRLHGPDDQQTLNIMGDLAVVVRYEGNYAEAEKMDREVLERRRRILGSDHGQTLMSMTNLASDLAEQGRYPEAEKLDRENLETERRVLGPQHPETLGAMSNLCDDLAAQGHYAEAGKLAQEVAQTESRVLGPEHPQTLDTMEGLAGIYRNQSQYAAAEKLDRKILEVRRRVLGPEHVNTVLSVVELATDLDSIGAYHDGEKLAADAFAIARRVAGPEDLTTLKAMQALAASIAHQGRFGEAEKLDRTTLEITSRVLGADNPITTTIKYHLAGLSARRGAGDEAILLLRQALGGLDVTTIHGMASDSAFKSLHGDPRFQALVADAQKRFSADQKPN